MSKHFEDACSLHCTDNGKTVTAEVIGFREEETLTVAIARQMKVTLKFDRRHKIYVGSSNGFEFTTSGPKVISVNIRR